MDTLFQDVRYALRSLRRTPMVTILAVLCLAIGIGVNTTIFSVVDAAFLSPFGFDEQDRLVVVNDRRIKGDEDDGAGVSYANLKDLDGAVSSLAGMAAVTDRSLTLSDGDEPQRYQGATVTWDLFSLLGVDPSLGRHFREDEDQAGAAGTVMLGDKLWRERYQSDPKIVGKAIPVNGKLHTVIGVMPPRFAFPRRHELWIPVAPIEAANPRSNRNLEVYARLAPGVTLDRARNEIEAASSRLAEVYPAENQGWVTRLRPLREALFPKEDRLSILAMMAAVTCVLLIACANVANLMLTRATARAREIAIRSAIGAGRGRIVRQLLTESVVIALAAGALGSLIAVWGLDLIDAAISPENRPPYYFQWKIDQTALLYTLVISIATGILFGLAPAIQASKENLTNALKDGARGALAGGRNRLRKGLVIAEVALALVLLVSAALFVRSFTTLQDREVGFDPSRLMTLRIYLPGEAYVPDEAKRLRLEDLVRRIEALPGVEAAVASNTIVMSGGGGEDGLIIEGRDVVRGEEPLAYYTGVTAHWHRTLDVPIVRGRDLTESEAQTRSGVAVVTESFGRRHWPDQDAIGRRFAFANEAERQWITVVGIARDYHVSGVDDRDVVPFMVVGYPYVPTLNNGITVRAKSGDPARLMPAIRGAIRASDASLPVFAVNTMDEVRRASFWEYGLFGSMFTIFGGIALLLATIGVYGVIAYGVSQRTHEIGVRMALGAHERDVLGMVMGQGLTLAGIGIGIGLVAALGAGRVIASILFTSPSDPVSFVGIAVLLTATVALASWVPARRAARVDPMVALRQD